ncbi:MAG: phosphate regulon sensor histidine kinase PhoR [Gammaproteobacteria bacterium]|nr:phosphate regulon sensor histidine kinase PhoR [Gammaproteobacteria bacterium]
MRNIWLYELWRLTRFLLPALLLGWMFDAPSLALFIALLLFISHQYRQFIKLYRWLNSSLDADLNVKGLWEELAYKIYHKRKRSRSRKKSLSKMLRRFQDSVTMMPDAAIVLDKDNNILWLNPAATKILRLSSQDIGQNIGNLIRLPSFIHFLRQAEQGESFEMRSPLDETQSLDLRIMPYGVGQQLLLIRNITQVQKLKLMRQEFVANVSHELRTPLTVILGYLESLQEIDDLSAVEIKQQLSKLSSPAQRMNQIVTDLLLLSRLDLDVPTNSSEAPLLDMQTLLSQLKKDGEQLSQGQHTISLKNTLQVKLKAVESEMYSALSNLISNAIRYSPDGGEIIIETSLDNNSYQVSVSDQGLGIAPQHIGRLTERFYRVDAGRSREVGGTGLGLAIVKQILRRHDAELVINSKAAGGSIFSCRFPVARVESDTVTTN